MRDWGWMSWVPSLICEALWVFRKAHYIIFNYYYCRKGRKRSAEAAKALGLSDTLVVEKVKKAFIIWLMHKQRLKKCTNARSPSSPDEGLCAATCCCIFSQDELWLSELRGRRVVTLCCWFVAQKKKSLGEFGVCYMIYSLCSSLWIPTGLSW